MTTPGRPDLAPVFGCLFLIVALMVAIVVCSTVDCSTLFEPTH